MSDVATALMQAITEAGELSKREDSYLFKLGQKVRIRTGLNDGFRELYSGRVGFVRQRRVTGFTHKRFYVVACEVGIDHFEEWELDRRFAKKVRGK